MGKVRQIDIRCEHCREWFPSPIGFGESESFESSTMVLIGNQVQCPKCGKMTGCDKENMRLRHEAGGFLGKDTA
jgi:predicted RNA-binding Zn-ribbon protein involved in translation (DUF1610 family)